jgi:P4 family phage/plasmid primase-like protien
VSDDVTVDSIIAANDAHELLQGNYSDLGNGWRFAQLYQHYARYVVEQKEWCIWGGDGHWVMDPSSLKVFALTAGVIRQLQEEAETLSDEPGQNGALSPAQRVRNFSIKTESTSARQSLLRDASSRLPISEERFDRVSDDLVAPNTTVNLMVGAQRASLSTDFNMRCTAVAYRPEVLDGPPPAKIKDYLNTFIPDEYRANLIFRALGAQLLAGNTHRLFIIIIGKTTTGKSQLVETIDELLGSYSKIAPASIFRGNLDDKPRPDLIDIVQRRIGFFSEASKAWELHGDRVKALSGDKKTSARGMRSDIFKDMPVNFTPVLVTNEMPRITGVDPGTKRRMLVIGFNRTLDAPEDAGVKERFVHDPEVQTWLLARLVQGCIESHDPVKMKEVIDAFSMDTAEAFEGLTHVGEFLEWLHDTEQLTEVSLEEQATYGVKSSYVTQSAMFNRYQYWVKELGDKKIRADALSLRDFNAQLTSSYGYEKVKSGEWRWIGRRLSSLLSNYASGM